MYYNGNNKNALVAPLAGAWIEMARNLAQQALHNPSLPSRERGLKSVYSCRSPSLVKVAPLAGAWIEIFSILYA